MFGRERKPDASSEGCEHHGLRKTSHVKPVLPTVPLQRCRDEFGIHVDILKASVLLVIAAEHNLVFSSDIHPNAVIRERIGSMEVEDEE